MEISRIMRWKYFGADENNMEFFEAKRNFPRDNFVANQIPKPV